jgi:hypothetical protein
MERQTSVCMHVTSVSVLCSHGHHIVHVISCVFCYYLTFFIRHSDNHKQKKFLYHVAVLFDNQLLSAITET